MPTRLPVRPVSTDRPAGGTHSARHDRVGEGKRAVAGRERARVTGEVPEAAALAHVEPTWRAEAACKDSTAASFYPPNTTESREQRQAREGAARALCARCGVRATCLEYALFVQEPYGIWGGLNELERRRLLRRRAAEL